MTTYAAWPGPEDLLGWLARYPGLEVTPFQAGAFAPVLAAAQREIETRSDRRFLAGASEERRFDPPTGSGLLDLPDLASAPGVIYQPSGDSSPTSWVTPDNYTIPQGSLVSTAAPGDADYYPIMQLVLPNYWNPRPYSTGWGTLAGAIRVTGQWGYGTVLPADVWEACCAGAAVLLWPALSYGLPGAPAGAANVTLTDTAGTLARSTAYLPQSGLPAAWQMLVEGVCRRYRRFAF